MPDMYGGWPRGWLPRQRRGSQRASERLGAACERLSGAAPRAMELKPAAKKPLLPKGIRDKPLAPGSWSSFGEGEAGGSLALLISAAIGTGSELLIMTMNQNV